MKHFLLLLNNGKHCIATEKELRKAELSAEKYDGFECWGNLGEIDPQKVADNRWTTVKPDFPCLFVTRSKYGSETYCKPYTITEVEGCLAVIGGNGEDRGALEDLQADEYFIIERTK